MICLIDNVRGVYAPPVFAERYGHLLSTDVREALLEGPDGEELLVTESDDVMMASRAEIETYYAEE